MDRIISSIPLFYNVTAIMKSATRIISEFGQKGHPLGKSIRQEEVPELTTRLRQRLGLSESELDFTPDSLKRLEDELLELPQRMDLQSLSEEEIVHLVREISAYIGVQQPQTIHFPFASDL